MTGRDYRRARALMTRETQIDSPRRHGMLERLRQALSGQDCRLCGQDTRASLCPGCTADLPRLSAARCPSCALPSPGGQICGRCVAEPPGFDATVAALAYGFPATRLIQDFKYAGAVGLARLLGGLLAKAVEPTSNRVDLVIPMPLAQARLKERGYNQALELARALPVERRLIDARAVERVIHGRPQAELPWRERRRNVRGAFRAGRRFDGLAVAVVDDVMTTGATLDELATTLKSAGAVRVENWVLARTLAPASGAAGDDIESRPAMRGGVDAPG
jgi:ComF family protein